MHRKLKNRMPLLEEMLLEILRCGILPEDTYLAGGTAVYFHLRHRISIDLDFFTPQPFHGEVFLNRTRECVDKVSVELLGKDTVIFCLGHEELKFSLFHFPYSLLSPTCKMPIQRDIMCPLASLYDIMAMKAVAINQRGSVKDFIDLFYMLRKTGLDFKSLAHLVVDKYDLSPGYDYHLKTSFVYFDDAEGEVNQIIMLRNNETVRLTDAEWENIKEFYRGFVE